MSDEEARARAASSDDENLVLVAGAGTGKTSVLVERVLHQLVRRGLGFEELVAITFTEKAAAEMRERVGAALARLSSLARSNAAARDFDPKNPADRAYPVIARVLRDTEIAELVDSRLRDLPRAAISTIHAYCAGLLRAYATDAGLDPDFSVDEGPRFEALRERLWNDWLDGDDRPSGSRAGLWARVLEKLEIREVRELAFRLARFDLPSSCAPATDEEVKQALEGVARRALAQIDGAIGSGSAGPESWLATAQVAFRALENRGLPALLEAWRSLEFQPARGPRKRIRDSAPTSKTHPQATALVAQIDGLLRKFERIDDPLMTEAVELVSPFVSMVRSAVRAHGLVPFDALLRLARDLLAYNPAIRREVGGRLRALLVDEFQDTDPLQYEVVFFLAEDVSGPAAEDAWETSLTPGKLFVVGDPKQAIYRFRGADLAAYHRARDHILASRGVELTLETNFRSPPDVLEPLDRLFKKLLEVPNPSSSDRDVRDAQSGYQPLTSGKPPARDPPCIEIWTVGGAGLQQRVGDARRAEAEAIAAWVEERVTRGDGPPKDVAILFRALSQAPIYMRALELRGVPCLLDGGRDRLERPEARILVALLRALANPADAPALLAILRSPLGGVSDAELAKYAASEGSSWTYLGMLPDSSEFPSLARALRFVAALRQYASVAPLAELLVHVCERTPFLHLVGLGPGGDLRVRSLRALLDELTGIAIDLPELDIAGLLPWLETLTRASDVGRARMIPNAVRLMSVHAAKGLEFKVVFLADLGRSRRDRGDARDELVRVARTSANTLAISTRAGLSASWIERERIEEAHAHAEDRRLFYVACTRAKERLILVHGPRRRDGGDRFVDYLADWGYTDEGLPTGEALQERGVAARQPQPDCAIGLPVEAPSEPGLEAVDRARAAVDAARALARPAFSSPSGLREDAEVRSLANDHEDSAPATRAVDTPDNRGARALGTVLHDALERWDFRDAQALLALVGSAAARIAAEETIDSPALARDARSLAEGLLASDLPAHLASVDVIGRELPILYRDADGTAWNGTIDLLYRDGDGRLVVSDYKTDRAPDAAARAHYGAQLSTYARGVARIFPDEPEPALELVWLRSGTRERLRLESAP